MQIKKYQSFAINLLFYTTLLVTLFLAACFARNNSSVDTVNNEITNDDSIRKDNLQVNDDLETYTYIVEPEDMVYPVVEAEEITNEGPGKASEKPRNNVVSKIDSGGIVFSPIKISVSSTRDDLLSDRPPIFDADCLNAEYPVKCSSDKLRNYIRENLDFPTQSLVEGHDGIEIVTFKVTNKGEVTEMKVNSKEVPCPGCREAVKNVIAAMPDTWSPALVDGDPVTTKITLPIYLNTM